jgi:hypothetical protein
MQTMKTSSSSPGKTQFKIKNRFTHTNGDASVLNQPTHEQIAKLACQLYIESGCQEGRDAENWLRAEQSLLEQAAWQAASARSQPARKPANGGKQRSSRQQL